MLRRQRQIRLQVLRFADAFLFAFSLWLAHYVRANWLKFEVFGGRAEIGPFSDYVWYLLLVLLMAPLLVEAQGFYNRPLLCARRRLAWQLFKGCGLTVAVMVGAIYLTRETDVARSVVIFFGVISFLLVMTREQLLRLWIESNVGQAQFKRRLVLMGAPEDLARVHAEWEDLTYEGAEILSELNLNEATTDQLAGVLHEHSINGVILVAKHAYFGQIEKAIEVCEREGVEVWLLADFFKTQISRTLLDEFQGRPMLVFLSAPEHSWESVAKRVLDVAVSFTLLVVLSPLLLLVALAIRWSSPGPVIFRQPRSGLNGRPFTMLKFRSMVCDAEARKEELAGQNEMSGPVFKVTNDPRVTTFGRFLRKYSIDELPQLVNVLRGEMSLVGPRPLPVEEVKKFGDYAHRRRLSVKPGLTCLWQVSGRNNMTDFQDWVRLDLEYIDNWSLWLDIKILIRTVPVVLAGTGAK